MPPGPTLATLPRLAPGATPATVRLLLPPNLESAARREAIAVRVEISIRGRGRFPAGMAPVDLELDVPVAQLGAVHLIESWNGGRAAACVQLRREQLAALVAVAAGEPAFFFANKPEAPIEWNEAGLAGVSGLLADTRKPAPEPAAERRAPAGDAPRRTPPTDATPPLVDGSEHFLAIQLPAREHPAHAELLELVKTGGFRLETSNRRWWLRDRHRTLAFLARNWSRLRDDWGAHFTDNFRRNTAHIRLAEAACELRATGDEFEVTLTVRAGDATGHEVHAALNGSRAYVESGSTIHLLDDAMLRRLHATQRALGGSSATPLLGRSSHRVTRAGLAEADGLLHELSPNLQPPEEWRRRTGLFRDPAALPPAPVDPRVAAFLRPYQQVGVAWLWHLRRHGLGGILADEMGLGKTLQALALLTAIRNEAPHSGPCLVVCPASLLENWRREAARFAPSLRVLVHHGAARAGDTAAFSGLDLLITSYGTLARDQELLHQPGWTALVADEAQHVKNRRSLNARALLGLRAGFRALLTGTPLENSLTDLESLFAVVLPGYLRGVPAEARGEERVWHEARLRRQAAPYLLRRTKTQVAPELPAKIEQTLPVEMTDAQRTFYEGVRSAAESELMRLEGAGGSEGRIRMALFTQLLRLRQVACDPRLVDPARDPAESAKLAALAELLDEAIDDGHRVLVFSQFTSLLALVRAGLEERGVGFCQLDGSMSPTARQAEVDRFNRADATIPVFLLSLKAGGVGLNLTGADTVVHLDPWWNPAVEAQATDRAHRIGQTRVVTSYKLIAAGTVEERVLAMQAEKRALLAAVFEESDAANAALTVADLRALVAR